MATFWRPRGGKRDARPHRTGRRRAPGGLAGGRGAGRTPRGLRAPTPGPAPATLEETQPPPAPRPGRPGTSDRGALRGDSAMSIAGRWRIVEMDLWEREALDLVGPAFVELAPDQTGSLGFIAVEGSVDWRPVRLDGLTGAEFNWNGLADDDPAPYDYIQFSQSMSWSLRSA